MTQNPMREFDGTDLDHLLFTYQDMWSNCRSKLRLVSRYLATNSGVELVKRGVPSMAVRMTTTKAEERGN